MQDKIYKFYSNFAFMILILLFATWESGLNKKYECNVVYY